MHMGNSYKHENSEDSEATFGIYDTLDKGERENGNGVLDFRRENG